MNEQGQVRQTVTVDGVKYYRDSLPQEAQQTLHNILIVQEEIEKIQRQLGIAQIAKEALTNDLISFSDQFEKVEETEEPKDKPKTKAKPKKED